MKRDLIWYENRSTAQVVSRGAKAKPKPSYGRVVKRRSATAREDALMDKGQYLRTRASGKGPDEPDTKTSRIRPALAAKQKARLRKFKQKTKG